jgi:dTDP-4-dehydrorhamnose reductase
MTIVLFGKNGQVGWELQRALAPLGDLIAFDSQAADFTDTERLRTIVRKADAEVIVNAAAYTAVDKAESEPELARRINAEAVRVLADEATRSGAWLVQYSTDYVFDGTQTRPYREDDATRPLSVYGSTKLEGEEAIRGRHPRHLIFRTSWVYAARGENFAKTMLRLAQQREALRVVADQHGVPTSAEFLADVTALALYRITVSREAAQSLAGTYHVVPEGETTWWDYACYVLDLAREKGVVLKTPPEKIERISMNDWQRPAATPKSSRLDTGKLRTAFNIRPPDWRYHVARLVNELTSQGTG